MLEDALKKYFGYQNFRNGQKEIIEEILNGKNVLAVMPTGAGKSLCYQLPSLLAKTYSIIISPLISLMQDQVEAINKKTLSAAFINSSLDANEVEKVLKNLNTGKIKMIFVAPEKLNNYYFVERIKQTKPEYIFVDEAHCISEWGHNFRPSYRNIKQFSDEIGIKKISAFTATATPEVRNDITEQLGFENPVVFSYGFERENLRLNVLQTKNKKEKILQLLKEKNSTTIVYTATRKNAEELSKYLKFKGINAEYYHAGLTTELRKIIQDDFLKNKLKVIVATNAFGMGIDKDDVRLVIHYNIPSSIENLYQEFGRAGRDGKVADVYLFYTDKDKYLQEFLLKTNYPTYEQIKVCYRLICDYHKIAVNTKPQESFVIDAGLQQLLQSKSISKNLITSILNNLVLNEYIEILSNHTSLPSVKFLIEKEKLKKYITNQPDVDLKDLSVALVKLYGKKIFEDKTEINIQLLQKELQFSYGKLEVLLNKLFDFGIIEYIKPTHFIKIRLTRERVPADKLRIDKKEIDKKLENANQKLDKVVDYVFTNGCRFNYILNYFGEDKNDYTCGKCDNCLSKVNNNTNNFDYISENIIETLHEHRGGLSRDRVLSILTGKTSSEIFKSFSTYANCIHFGRDEINNAINKLISQSKLKEYQNIIYSTENDQNVNKTDTEETKSIFKYEDNLELFNKLREERKRFAKKFSQNPEIICPEKILIEISKARPLTPSEIMSIKGFTQRMFNKIGEDFLEIIKEHKTETEIKTKRNELPKHISQTYMLIEKGYAFEEIVNLLKATESIVSLHVETILNYYPDLNINNLIGENEFKEIAAKIETEKDSLKEIKEKLPEKISYAKIRIVKAKLFKKNN